MNEFYKNRRLWLVALMAIIISVLHYSTAVTMGYMHDFYKLLYYLPIILAAFFFRPARRFDCFIQHQSNLFAASDISMDRPVSL